MRGIHAIERPRCRFTMVFVRHGDWPQLRGSLKVATRSGILATLLLFAPASSADEAIRTVKPTQADEIVDRLIDGLKDYVFPDAAQKLQRQMQAHRSEYRVITDPKALAARLTDDLRAAGHDHHLQVTHGEELGVQKEPTPEERSRAHAFDLANGYGIRGARRLPGNIGYVNLAYFSPDANAGEAIAATLRLVSGTDALIVDLRRNGGGSGEAATALLSYFFEEPAQLSSILERTNGQIRERQKWTMPYVAGPRYLGRPVFILTSRRTHSAAELCAYDLKNMHRATIVGERTAGNANSSTGEIALGYGFAALIPNGETRSPVTHSNWEGTGVQPDIVTAPKEALITAYQAALKGTKPSINSPELEKERRAAAENPRAALLEEIAEFPEK